MTDWQAIINGKSDYADSEFTESSRIAAKTQFGKTRGAWKVAPREQKTKR